MPEGYIAKMNGKKAFFAQFKKVMSCGCKKDTCTEILFSIEGNAEFRECWMGKTWKDATGSTVYWFGLTPDGKSAYEYDTFEEMAAAKVFCGSSLQELSDAIVFLEVDGLDPADRFLQLAAMQGENGGTL